MNEILKRIKRCVISGHVRFTFKAELEMLSDQLSRTDVLESILNAQVVTKGSPHNKVDFSTTSDILRAWRTRLRMS